MTKISSLKKTEINPIDKGLGYNGFSITRTEQQFGAPEGIEIKNGIVLVNYGKDGLAKYLDTHHSVEKWVLEVGTQYLAPRLVEYIRKEIENDIQYPR